MATPRIVPAFDEVEDGEARVGLSRAIEMTPNSGPSASIANAQDQPTTRTTGGTSQIDTIVRAKPTQGWVVSAVPT